MSQPPKEPDNTRGIGEHHTNVSDESRATLNADVQPSEAADIAHEERLEVLIESGASHPQN